MPSLSDKLKGLGVQVGAQNLPRQPVRNTYPIEKVVPGYPKETVGGETYVVETVFPHDYQHGHSGLKITASLDRLAHWAGERLIGRHSNESLAYLDIETTGLSGGTGTYAFLIGAGRFTQDGFLLSQFFMRDPIEEPAQLIAFEEFLAPCDTLVTFNGKAFDVPILNTRFITHGWNSPLASLLHIDLLHISRRLWHDRLPSRTLGNIETLVLSARRTEEDVPGWLIPQLYFDYLRDGDARPLKSVFYHNSMDVVAMAALLNHISNILEDPTHSSLEHGLDYIGLGRLFEDLGSLDDAVHCYQHSLSHDLPEELLSEVVKRLAYIRKRRGEYQEAIALWVEAANQKKVYAHLELAKYFEHYTRDYEEAARWTIAALELVTSLDFPSVARQEWLADLEHRLSRLHRKLGRGK